MKKEEIKNSCCSYRPVYDGKGKIEGYKPHEITLWHQYDDGSDYGNCDFCHQWVGTPFTTVSYTRQSRIWANAKKVKATLTNAPCIASCWYAEGFDCACSCGGKNHGIGHNPKKENI